MSRAVPDSKRGQASLPQPATGEDLVRFAARIAPVLCRQSRRDDCSPYHGFWPMLRRLGLAAAPDRHAGFFARALATAVRPGATLLIAGAADERMLSLCAEVSGAWSTATVIDCCATPLAIVAASTAQSTRPVRVMPCDLARDATTAVPFDVACSHSLITAVAPADRVLVLQGLRRLLAPRGAWITVARIDPDAASAAWMAEAPFVARVLAAAEARGVATVGLAEDAALYARWTRVAPLASVEALEALLDAAGWRVEQLAVVTVPGAATGAQLGGAARGATYVELIATPA